MKIAKEIVVETLERISEGEEGNSSNFILETAEKMQEENPYLIDFINAVIEVWQEKSPATSPEQQAGILFTYLVAEADMFRRQEEVNNLKKKFGKLRGVD